MDRIIPIKTFARFLKCHHCYSSFKENVQNSYGRSFPDLAFQFNPSLWLILSFSWKYTKQGVTYWNNINKQWENLYQRTINKINRTTSCNN